MIPSNMTLLTRRQLLGGCLSLAFGSSFPHATCAGITGTLMVDPAQKLHTVPPNFIGLSYESAQLANADFFSAANTPLIALICGLSPCGVLRLGGGTSNFTTYSQQTPETSAAFETFGPDTSHSVKQGTITSARALHNLRAFLDQTNWSCIYGLNLGQGTKENAAEEAEAVCSILGPRLLALQIGNEPDAIGRYRPHGYSPDDYIREWLEFHEAIVARVPHAKFAGPDISHKLPYFMAFAREAARHPNVILLTFHYYAMGPAGNPLATTDNLLRADPQLATLKWQGAAVIEDMARAMHLPCRVSEANSCWNGGQPGVSNTFASTLWCADMLLHFASLGIAGVHLHGGGQGWYSPIVGSPSTGFRKRPEYFGIQFAQHFAATTLLRTVLNCDSERISAWAASNGDKHYLLAIINKANIGAKIQLTGPLSAAQWNAQILAAPSVNAIDNIAFHALKFRNPVHLPPHSALLAASED
jgi:hypothetical protein